MPRNRTIRVAPGLELPDDVVTRKLAFIGQSDAFAALWESIHGRGAWDRPTWVWVVGFEPTEAGR